MKEYNPKLRTVEPDMLRFFFCVRTHSMAPPLTPHPRAGGMCDFCARLCSVSISTDEYIVFLHNPQSFWNDKNKKQIIRRKEKKIPTT